MRRESTINKIRDIVKSVSPKAKVILYGSQARNEATEDSDIDVLILVDTDKLTYEAKVSFIDPLFDLELEDNVMISPIVYSQKEWYNRPFRSPFYMNVLNEGIEL